MTFTLLAFHRLTESQVDAVRKLQASAAAVDHCNNKIYWDSMAQRSGDAAKDVLLYDNDNLIGYLGAFEFNPHILDVTLMIDPAYRQRGAATQLLHYFIPLVSRQQIKYLHFSCHRDATIARNILSHKQATIRYSEYSMALRNVAQHIVPSTNNTITLQRATINDLASLAALDEVCFGSNFNDIWLHMRDTLPQPHRHVWLVRHNNKAIGKMHVTVEQDTAYIHDFCIEPKYQGQGIGSDILRKTLQQINLLRVPHAVLDVKCDNPRAIHIYERQGFSITAIYDFWRLDVAPEWLATKQIADK